jgi:hypothetical protein
MSAEPKTKSHAISTLNEGPLHAALKDWYAEPGDATEVLVDGFLVDIVRNGLLIEIQTRSFSPLRRKLARLVEGHRVRLVYPIAREKWVLRMKGRRSKKTLGRRKSPKRGRLVDVFAELVSVPALCAHENFSLEVLFTREEEVRRQVAGRAWRRRGWVTQERRLLDVVGRCVFETPADFAALVPDELGEPFDTAQLARAIGRSRWLAQKAAYALREMGAINAVGKRGNAILYARTARPAGR